MDVISRGSGNANRAGLSRAAPHRRWGRSWANSRSARGSPQSMQEGITSEGAVWGGGNRFPATCSRARDRKTSRSARPADGRGIPRNSPSPHHVKVVAQGRKGSVEQRGSEAREPGLRDRGRGHSRGWEGGRGGYPSCRQCKRVPPGAHRQCRTKRRGRFPLLVLLSSNVEPRLVH